jgi:hypothetical protein
MCVSWKVALRMVNVAPSHIAVALVLAGVYVHASSQEQPIHSAPGTSAQLKLITSYCVTCHNGKLRTADLDLDRISAQHITANAPAWEKVIRKLRTGAMPPAGVPRPDKSTSDTFVVWLEGEMDRAASTSPNPGRTAIHRVNRAEYANAVRDLLSVSIEGDSLLPPDDAGHGFDNVAEMLSISPLLVERYVAAAAKISLLAVGDPSTRPFIANYDISRQLTQDDRMSDDLPAGSRGGIAIRHHFPLDGEYVIKIRLQRNKDNFIRGIGEPHQLDVRIDGERVKRFIIGGDHRGRSGMVYTFVNPEYRGDPEQDAYEYTADESLQVRISVKAGTRLVAVAFMKETVEAEYELFPQHLPAELIVSGYKGGNPDVDQVSISGPYNARGLSQTPSRQRVFVCYPDGASDENACAKQIISRLARHAYRKPITDQDIQPLLELYRAERSEGGFEVGIRAALQRILVSPQFLFRIEQDPPNVTPGTAFRISELELASRLSFFLWSSIPDDELLGLAEGGTLGDPLVLEYQVRRMLADSRSRALVENFVAQWLSLRNISKVSPDPNVFPEFDQNLREALSQETKLFVESMMREDSSVLRLLDADYTFLNERLARHYRIPDIFGSHFRRVELGDENRRGLLGQGSVLAVTSYGNRTAPTLRGKWVLEQLLGTPPPQPPPNVPALKENERREGKTLTMRQRMEEHRANPVCASCHAPMDPLGFALENFDALGRWRTTEAETLIDASGLLPDGTKFNGPAELRKILLKKPEQIVQTIIEKLLTYSLGRGLEYYDAPVIRKIMHETSIQDYRWAALITAIVKSTPFQMRRATEP